MGSPEAWLNECFSQAQSMPESNVSLGQLGENPGMAGEVTGKETDPEDRKDLITMKLGSKPHSTPLTLKWLEENYEVAEGVCIPRSTLYMHYLGFCEQHDIQPVNAASFGKIIRQPFPQITTRRLGTRGQSKYHYYGIAVKSNSPFYDVMYSKRDTQSGCSEGKRDAKQFLTYSPRMKLGTLLPEFPQLSDLKLPAHIPHDKVSTFIIMYRTHCQRVLDTVIRANFDEVQNFLLHFWQGMPQHIVPIMSCREVVIVVGICDSILYKAISSVLMPSVMHALPESLTQVIRKFAKQLDDWLHVALDDLPEELRMMKFGLARRFTSLLRRQTSLNHLCQASRSVVLSGDITVQMLEDWANIDLGSICKQTLYTMDLYREKDHEMIVELYTEFQNLLEARAPTESYLDWLNAMVERCVVKPCLKTPGTLKRRARDFLLRWSCFGTRVIRDMTLHSATSFGSFHLLHLMFDDYVLYLVETLHTQERTNELLRMITGKTDSKELLEDLLMRTNSCYSPTTHTGLLPDNQMYPYDVTNEEQTRDTVITSVADMYREDSSDSGMDEIGPGTGHCSPITTHFDMSLNKTAMGIPATQVRYDTGSEDSYQHEFAKTQGLAGASTGNMESTKYPGYVDYTSSTLPPYQQSTETGSCAYGQYSNTASQYAFCSDQSLSNYSRTWQGDYLPVYTGVNDSQNNSNEHLNAYTERPGEDYSQSYGCLPQQDNDVTLPHPGIHCEGGYERRNYYTCTS